MVSYSDKDIMTFASKDRKLKKLLVEMREEIDLSIRYIKGLKDYSIDISSLDASNLYHRGMRGDSYTIKDDNGVVIISWIVGLSSKNYISIYDMSISKLPEIKPLLEKIRGYNIVMSKMLKSCKIKTAEYVKSELAVLDTGR